MEKRESSFSSRIDVDLYGHWRVQEFEEMSIVMVVMVGDRFKSELCVQNKKLCANCDWCGKISFPWWITKMAISEF